MSVGHSGVYKPRWRLGGTLFTNRHSVLVAPAPKLPLVPRRAMHPTSLPVERGLEFSPVTKLWFRQTLSSTQHQNAGSLSLTARAMIRVRQTQQPTKTAPTVPGRRVHYAAVSSPRSVSCVELTYVSNTEPMVCLMNVCILITEYSHTASDIIFRELGGQIRAGSGWSLHIKGRRCRLTSQSLSESTP